MTQTDFRTTVNGYADLVESVEVFRYEAEENISQLKERLRLFDGTVLWVREVRIEEILKSCSYYWLHPDETAIMGWDNAPHHREIASFPHHRHLGDRIESSNERNLKDVLYQFAFKDRSVQTVKRFFKSLKPPEKRFYREHSF